MPTLVATLDIHIADRRSRRKAFSHRSSYGEVTYYSQDVLELQRGDSKEIAFDRCIFLYIRDEVDLQIIDSNNNTVTYTGVVGFFAHPVAGKVIVSVDENSTISLGRVIHVLST